MRRKKGLEFLGGCLATFLLGNAVGNELLAGAGIVLLERTRPQQARSFLGGFPLAKDQVRAIYDAGRRFFELGTRRRWRAYLEAAATVRCAMPGNQFLVTESKPVLRDLLT